MLPFPRWSQVGGEGGGVGGRSRFHNRIGRGYRRGCIMVWIGGDEELCHFWGELGN